MAPAVFSISTLSALAILFVMYTPQGVLAAVPHRAPYISPEDCAAYQRPEELWLGFIGISGLEGIRLPGASGHKELGLNQIASVKWLSEAKTKNTGVFNGSFVDFYYRGGNSSDANGDPRLALVAATRVCSDPEAENRLLGFYGGISSEESKAVQLVASTFGYSQVSPVSEGAELSDTSRYPTFNRVFTPSFKLAPAIVEVIKHFGWQRIGIVAGETSEDFSAVRSLQTAAKGTDIHIVSSVNAISGEPAAMEELVEFMISEMSDIRVWVMFFTRDSVQTMRFFSYAAGTPLMRSDNVFIEGGRLADFVHIMRDYLNSSAPPSEWKLKDRSVEGAYEAMSGVLSVAQSKGAGSQAYAAFLEEINAAGIHTWMGPDMREAFTGVERLKYSDMLHSTATLTYDAMNVFAKAADAMIDDGLGCRIVGPYRNHSLYLQYIRGLQFEGVSGYLAFDENGDRVSDYAVYNLQFDTSSTGRDRLLSVEPEMVMAWRVAPPPGEAALVSLPGKKVQWRSGMFGPIPLDGSLPPPPAPHTDAESGVEDRVPSFFIASVSTAVVLLLAAALAGALFLLNRHFAHKAGKMRDGVLDGHLLEYDKRPAHSDAISIELNGTFMFRDVRVHVLNTAAGVSAGSILIRCKAPLTNFPTNGMVAVHRAAAMKGCVENRDSRDEVTSPLLRRSSMARSHGRDGGVVVVDASKRSSIDSPDARVSRHPLRSLPSRAEHTTHAVVVLPPVPLRALTPSNNIVIDADPPHVLPSGNSTSSITVPTILPGSADESPDDVESAFQTSRRSPTPTAMLPLTVEGRGESNRNMKRRAHHNHGTRALGVRRSTVLKADLEAINALKQSVKSLMKLRGSRQLQPVIGLTFVGTSSSQSAPAIVAEHFAGGNLHDIIHNSATPLDLDVRLQLLTDMATGLKTLHSQEPPMVHPTISLYNTLLDDEFRAVLTQYGYPTVLGAVNGGLLQYAAPEVLGGEEPSPPSDIYSWAMISIEVLERCQLYAGLEAGAVLTGVRDEWLRPLFGEDYPQGWSIYWWSAQRRTQFGGPLPPEVMARLKEISLALKSRAMQADDGAGVRSARELLHSIFPSEVAAQLEMGKRVEPEQHSEVTVFFSDIVGFTNISASLTPAEVMEMLNRLYLALDGLTAKHGLFKVETIGDAYMAVGNLHPKAEDHTARVARFATEAVSTAAQIPVQASKPELGNVNMRVGFHVGPVVASVIGDLNPRYCLFGDTVNTASRMESTSIAGRIHLSHTAFCALMEQAPGAQCELRTDLGEIKGKGRMKTYFLDSV